MLLRRPSRAVLWTALLILVTGSVWWLGGKIKSPEQKAAEVREPPASPITAPVEFRRLREAVVLQGTVRSGREVSVAPEPPGEGKPLITRMPLRSGKKVGTGTLLVEVAGRPLFALPGRVPMYRDLWPGQEGDDVAQLQRALTALGHATYDRTGYFGTGTAAAVSRFFRARGYEPTLVESEPEEPEAEAEPKKPEAEAEPGRSEDRDAETGQRKPRPKKSVMVKADEILFVPELPARVSSVTAGVGDKVAGEIMRLSSGRLKIEAPLDAAVQDLVQAGQQVEFDLAGRSVKAKVGDIVASRSRDAQEGEEGGGEGGEAGPAKNAVVRLSDTAPVSWLGRRVDISVFVQDTGRKVLAVPSAAVWTRADGSSILVVSDGAKNRDVPVKTGMSADGYIEISEAEGLTEGALVLLSGEPR